MSGFTAAATATVSLSWCCDGSSGGGMREPVLVLMNQDPAACRCGCGGGGGGGGRICVPVLELMNQEPADCSCGC